MKLLFYLLFNFFIVNSLRFNYNFKLSNKILCNYLTPNEYNWNNIFNYNSNNNYKGLLCVWKSENWINYTKKANKVLKTYNKYKFINNSNIIINKLYLKNNKILYNKNNNIDIENNNYLHLNNNEFRINFNIPKNDSLIFYINVNHPYNNDTLFNIKIVYFLENNTLSKIYLHRLDKYNNFYWNNNNTFITYKKNLNNSNYLFGKNYNIYLPLKYYKNKNKLTLFNIKYPYLYDYPNNYNEYNLYNNIQLNLPDDIILYIPKKINFVEKYKISIMWKFKNEFKYNIFDINYNKTNYNFNIFTFI